MKKNDVIQIKIESISSDGNGIGHYDGMAVFVPYSAVGDHLVVRIERVEKAYCYGRIISVIVPSCDRIPPDCELFGKCGGCSFRHINYEAELNAKQEFVESALRRIGKINHPVLPIIYSDKQFFYRNKAQYPVGTVDGKLYAGFFAPRSHRLLSFLSPCRLQPEIFHSLATDVCEILNNLGCTSYNETSHTGLVRHLLIRQSSVDNSLLLTIVINGEKLPNETHFVSLLTSKYDSLRSISISVNTQRGNTILSPDIRLIYGTPSIPDEILGIPVAVTPLSFFQINHAATELLYLHIKDLVEKSHAHTIFDLYCGAGTIGLSVTGTEQNLYGIEIVEDAINSAILSAKTIGRANAHFLLGDANKVKSLLGEGLSPDLIITDPPRKGCSPEVLDLLVQSNCANLIMVSCNAATLARDLQYLTDNGYSIHSIQPFDMFPRTKHVETVCCLYR